MELSEAATRSDYPAPEHLRYPQYRSNPVGGFGLFSHLGPFDSYPEYTGFDSLTRDSPAHTDLCQALRG